MTVAPRLTDASFVVALLDNVGVMQGAEKSAVLGPRHRLVDDQVVMAGSAGRDQRRVHIEVQDYLVVVGIGEAGGDDVRLQDRSRLNGRTTEDCSVRVSGSQLGVT